MKLYDYLGHHVRVQTKSGETYVGYVEKHFDPIESEDGKEGILLEQPTVAIYEDNIFQIEDIVNSNVKRVILLDIENISNELDVSIRTVKEQLSNIEHPEYQVDCDHIMYDVDTAFKVAANLGKMNMFEWYCDECDAYLNDQDGFEDNNGKWICKECGHENIISKEQLEDL